MKHATQKTTEGAAAFAAFRNALRSIVSVPYSVIREREAEYRLQSRANPNRRGPKPDGIDGTESIVRQLRNPRLP